MDFNTLEIIGLAFLSGLHVAETAEEVESKNDDKEEEEEKINTVEVKKVTPEEMGEIIEDLKKKILGGK